MDLYKALEDAFVTSKYPIGRAYIAPNGMFISTIAFEDDTFGEPNHTTILDYLYDTGYIESPSYSELEERGYIRVSNWDSTIILPRIKPTEEQYRAIRDWIDAEYEEENMRDVLIDTPTEFKKYNLYDGEVDSKYIVDRIRRYYATNILYESTDHLFPNSKVKQVVYHTSNKDFDKFDSRKKGSNTGWIDTNLGYFFSDNKEITKQFGNITKAYYIDIRKPLDLRIWRGIRADSFEELNPDEQQIVIDLVKSQGVEPNDEYIQSIIDGASDFDAQSEIREQLADKESMRNLRRLGYDSIIDIMDRDINANEYIVFNSNQIKVKERLEESSNQNIGYRTEETYGSSVRDLRDVIEFEIVELGNIDIPDTLLNTFAHRDEQGYFIEEILDNFEDSSEEDKQNLVDVCVDIIKQTYPNAKYCLWLASKDSIIKYYGGTEENIDTYEIQYDKPISDLGFNEDGCLYVYDDLPKPIRKLTEALSGNKLNLSEYKIKDILINNPDLYRILYDARLDKYMIGNSYDIVHRDLIIDALKSGYYEGQRDFIETFGAIDNYIEIGLGGYYDKELVDEDIDPFLYPLVFIPKGKEEDIDVEVADDYIELFEYDFGYILSRENDFRETSLYKILGEPVSTKYL